MFRLALLETGQFQITKVGSIQSEKRQSLYFGASLAPRIEQAASQIQDSSDLSFSFAISSSALPVCKEIDVVRVIENPVASVGCAFHKNTGINHLVYVPILNRNFYCYVVRHVLRTHLFRHGKPSPGTYLLSIFSRSATAFAVRSNASNSASSISRCPSYSARFRLRCA